MTAKDKAESKMKTFLNWLKANGAIFDKVDYPVYVNGVRSAVAKEVIEPGEAFIFIPNNLLITVEHARTSELEEVFKSHDQLFVSSPDRDFFILIVFFLFERTTKKEDSFWHPFFEQLPNAKYPALWDPKLLLELDDPELLISLKSSKDKVEKDWENVQKLMDLYPHYFMNVTRADFDWAVYNVSTRCFDAPPTTANVPLCDALNHKNRSKIQHMFVHKNLHLQSNKIYLYETDYETFYYDESESKQHVNVARLFREDTVADASLVQGQYPDPPEQHPDCF